MKKRSYGRFYGVLRALKGYEKEDAVFDYTNGRTTHLNDLSDSEYTGLCNHLESLSIADAEKKEAGSKVLTLLAKLGYPAYDAEGWRAVDNYLLHPRIAGKKYRDLSTEERRALIPKLNSILSKEQIKKSEPCQN